MQERSYYVYIIANKWATTLYIGVTNDLYRRTFEHRAAVNKGFSQRYHLKELVYYEEFDSINAAIGREKQLKRWHRDWKFNLIKTTNPKMVDLAAGWFNADDLQLLKRTYVERYHRPLPSLQK